MKKGKYLIGNGAASPFNTYKHNGCITLSEDDFNNLMTQYHAAHTQLDRVAFEAEKRAGVPKKYIQAARDVLNANPTNWKGN